MHNISNVFWNNTLRVSDGLSVHRKESRLYIQHEVYVIQVLWLLASNLYTSLTSHAIKQVLVSKPARPFSFIFHHFHAPASFKIQELDLI